MRTARLTTDQGSTWITSINGTDSDIVKYFLGRPANFGAYGSVIDDSLVVKVEIDEVSTYEVTI